MVPQLSLSFDCLQRLECGRMGSGYEVRATSTLLHYSIRCSRCRSILPSSEQVCNVFYQYSSLALITLAISHIILAILATGEAFVVDRRPGQVAKADLRLPIAEEGVSHRYVLLFRDRTRVLIDILVSTFNRRHSPQTEASYISEVQTEQ